MLLNDFFDVGETDTGALVFSAGVQAVKRREESPGPVRIKSATVVANVKCVLILHRPILAGVDIDSNPRLGTLGCVF